jgi:hypothetical protein
MTANSTYWFEDNPKNDAYAVRFTAENHPVKSRTQTRLVGRSWIYGGGLVGADGNIPIPLFSRLRMPPGVPVRHVSADNMVCS